MTLGSDFQWFLHHNYQVSLNIILTTVSKNTYITGFLGSFQNPNPHRPPCNKYVCPILPCMPMHPANTPRDVMGSDMTPRLMLGSKKTLEPRMRVRGTSRGSRGNLAYTQQTKNIFTTFGLSRIHEAKRTRGCDFSVF